LVRCSHGRKEETCPAGAPAALESRRRRKRTGWYYGDNLDALRQYVTDESVDLVYLDPPFNSNANYNVLFAEKSGTRSAAHIQAFEDTLAMG
jgi:16S rRNA G966 N2-methylase RsmD